MLYKNEPLGYKVVDGKTYFTEAIKNVDEFNKIFTLCLQKAENKWVDDHIDDRNLFGFRKFRSRKACLKHLHDEAAGRFMNVETVLYQRGYLDDDFDYLCDHWDIHKIMYGTLMMEVKSIMGADECLVSPKMAQAVEFWESEHVRNRIKRLAEDVGYYDDATC